MGVDRIAGQASSETIIILVLVALATVVLVTFYGRRVGTKYSCAGESVANGGGASAGCSGEASGGVASGGVEVDAVSGAGPRVASSAPGAGTATGGAAQRRPGEAARPDILPVIPTPRGGVAPDATLQDQAGKPAVAANVPVVPSSGGGSRSASSAAPPGKPGESADNLSDFLKPGGPGSGGAPQLAGQSLANAPGLPSLGGGSGTASGGASPQKLGAPVVVDNPPPIFKDDHGSGMVPLQPFKPQSFGEVNFGAPNGGGAQPGCVLCGGGPSQPDMKQMNDFMLGGTTDQRVNEAVKVLHDVEGGDVSLHRGDIIEVQSADGSSKFFRVDHPFKEVHDHTFGRVPEDGVEIDTSKVVVEEVNKRNVDPNARKTVVSDSQAAGDMALDLYRQPHAPTDLNKASVGFLGDRAKARADFVKQAVDDRVTTTVNDIQTKKNLESHGATVNTKLPFESEYNAAFNNAFNDKLAKTGSSKDARYAGMDAGRQAVADAVKKTDLADRAGKVFDQRYDQFAKKNTDAIKKAEEGRKETAKQAAEHDKRRRMEDAIALVLARASATNYMCRTTACNKDSDEAIHLIEAYVAAFGTDTVDGGPNGFIHQNADALKKLLGPYGFRFVDGPGYGMNPTEWQKEVLYISLENSRKTTDARDRRDLRLGIRPPGFEDVEDYHNQFWASTAAPPDEEYHKDNQLVAGEVDGEYFQGTRAQYHYEKTIGHALRQLHQIAEAGPGSLIGRIFGGEKGAEIGAMIDEGLIAAAGIKGGRGGWGEGAAAEYQPRSGQERLGVEARVERAPPPEPMPEPDLPGAPPKQSQPPPEPAKQVASANGAAGPPPAPPAGPPPAPPKPQQQETNPGNTGALADRQAEVQAKKAQLKAEMEAKIRARGAQREAETARALAAARAHAERVAPTLPAPGEKVTTDQALDGLKNKGWPTVASMNGKRHQSVWEDELKQKGPAPDVYRDGNQMRINYKNLNDAQKKDFDAEATRVGGNRPKVDNAIARDNTQPQGQAPLDKTQIGHAPGPQAPGDTQIGHAPGPLPGNSGNTGNPPAQNRPAQQTVKGNNTTGVGESVDPRAGTVRVEGQRPQQQVQQQQARKEKSTAEIPRQGAPKGGASEQKTGEIPVLGAGNRAQKADTGAPGNFGPEDVVFGLSVGDPKTGPIAKFAGKALNAANPDHLPLSENAKTPDGVANETVGAARTVLKASGGKLRFSLHNFNVDEALTPGSEHFNTTTSIEFRRVLADPFFKGRVRFYDGKGVDVTDSIVKRSVPK